MKNIHLPTGSFGIAVLAFLLPFITVGCNGSSAEVAQFTGFNLMGGGSIQGQAVQGDWRAMVAFGAVLLATVICAVNANTASRDTARGVYLFAAACGAVTAGMLFWVKSYLDGQVGSQGGGIITVKYEFGYWIALLCSAAGAGLAWYTSTQLEGGDTRSSGISSTD